MFQSNKNATLKTRESNKKVTFACFMSFLSSVNHKIILTHGELQIPLKQKSGVANSA
jgi:hypothetical protein